MWNRKMFKNKAKDIMKNNFMELYLCAFILMLLSSIGNFFTHPILQFGIISVFSIFVIMPLGIGLIRVYHKAKNNDNFSRVEVFHIFDDKNYLNIVKINFFVVLKTLAWTLLFIIPGIYKSLEYSMIPFILANDSSLSSKKVFELSKKMTYKHIGDLLILSLSFIGWYVPIVLINYIIISIFTNSIILGMILISIVDILLSSALIVYIQMTMLEVYENLLNNL